MTMSKLVIFGKHTSKSLGKLNVRFLVVFFYVLIGYVG